MEETIIKEKLEIKVEVVEDILYKYVIDDGELVYMDILHFTPDEFDKLDVEKLHDELRGKFMVWKEYVKTPTPEPTEEEKQIELDKLIREKEAIEAKLSTLTAELTAIQNGKQILGR